MLPRAVETDTFLASFDKPKGLFNPPRWGNPFLFYFDHVYMIGGVTCLGGLPGLPGLPGRVTRSAGVTICHVNVSKWGNPPSRGRVHCKKLKSGTYMF